MTARNDEIPIWNTDKGKRRKSVSDEFPFKGEMKIINWFSLEILIWEEKRRERERKKKGEIFPNYEWKHIFYLFEANDMEKK